MDLRNQLFVSRTDRPVDVIILKTDLYLAWSLLDIEFSTILFLFCAIKIKIF